MITNNEPYPWEDDDKYDTEVKEVISKEMHEYDSKYIDWLYDCMYLPERYEDFLDDTHLHQMLDLLSSITEIEDAYILCRESAVLEQVRKRHSLDYHIDY